MARTTQRSRTPGRKLLANALRISVLLMALSGLLIVIIGTALSSLPIYQAIAFAVLGAFLQTAVLGLIYEVFLRNEVEDATLEKLGTARDIREHGLIRIGREAAVDWSYMLEATRELCVVTHDPKGLLGRSDDQILRRAADGYLGRFTIVVPKGSWRTSEKWLQTYRDKWRANAPDAQFFAVKSDADSSFEFIGTDTRSVLLLPRLLDIPGVEAAKLFQFRESEPWGVGSWLARQRIGLAELNGVIGHSPPPPPPRVEPQEPEDESGSPPDSEELT